VIPVALLGNHWFEGVFEDFLEGARGDLLELMIRWVDKFLFQNNPMTGRKRPLRDGRE